MATRIKKAPILILAGGVGLFLGARYLTQNSATDVQSKVAPKIDLPNTPEKTPAASAAVSVSMPGTQAASVPGPKVLMQVMAWNSQMGLMFANGGKQTTTGSLMATHNVNLQIDRQDDTVEMANSLVAFAQALQSNPQPNDKVHFVVVMGDGSAAFLRDLNEKLAKISPDSTAEIVGAFGFSRGEDCFMGPPAWKTDPQKARGALITGVVRDGDWNIALKWAGDNGIPNNPDGTTYDPDALNWVETKDFLDAPQKYNANYCEERPVVKSGGGKQVKTGEKKRVCVDSTVTWTPGDVQVVHGRGGLVKIASTAEYIWQMPSTVIGIKKWNKANAPVVANLLAAALEGGDAVNGNDAALVRASEVSNAVYQEKDTDSKYWLKYYKGVTESDKQGNKVPLGGSKASGPKTMEHYFGLASGTPANSTFYAVYRNFGSIVSQQYPKLMPSFEPAERVVNLDYLKAALVNVGKDDIPVAVADIPVFQASKTPMTAAQTVSSRVYNITFVTGSAQIKPESATVLRQALDSIRTTNLKVEIHGHTDNTGDPEGNRALSQSRALAVAQWFKSNGGGDIPGSRLLVVGHGQDLPIASNAGEAGRSQNRRVEIKLGVATN